MTFINLPFYNLISKQLFNNELSNFNINKKKKYFCAIFSRVKMRKNLLLIVLLALTTVLSAQDNPEWSIRYNNGLELKSSDNRFKFKMGGRVQFDIININEDDSVKAHYAGENGAEFRRLRWYTSGTLYGNIKFKLQFDFAKGDAGVKDAYLEIVKIPVIGHFRVGHFKQPFGFEMQTSSKYVLFMERGLTNIFTPERDLGVMIYNKHLNNRISWYAGYFYPTGGVGQYLGDQYRLTFRLTGLPLYKPEGRYTVLHIGAAYEFQSQKDQALSFSERPEAHLAPKYINLTIDTVNNANVFGGEMSFILGRFAFQGEYMIASVHPSATSSAPYSVYNYSSYYGNFSWFITGEHRNYDTGKSAYNRVTPKKNLGKGGAGAWELALRVSHVDMNDKGLDGGTLTDYTVGLNWYLNPAVRFMFNYINAEVADLGRSNIGMLRFQVAF